MTIYSPPSMSYRHCNIWNYIITLFVSIFVSLSFAHFRASLQQLRTPTIQVCLPALKSFTVYHQRIATRKEFGYFIRWTRSIITNSLIEKLVVMPDSHFWMGAPVSFDGLITHLQSKHHETLRVIRMDVAYVRQRTLRKMVEECHKLEEIGIGVHANVLVS